MNPHELFVLAIDQYGNLSVCAVGDLYDRLADESMDDAIMNAGIDTLSVVDREAVMRVRRLNETGDADAFWA